VTRALAAAVLSAIIVVLTGPTFIRWLQRLRAGQQIRAEGPAAHQAKQGTPTMGGLMIIGASVLAYVVFSNFAVKSLAVLVAFVGCGLIGLADDWLKVVRRRSLGLRGRWKLVGQALVAVVLSVVASHEEVSRRVFLPIIEVRFDLGYAWYGLVFLIVLGATNAVNLTDGLDGLAAGTTTLALLCFTAMTVVAYQAGQRGVDRCISVAGGHPHVICPTSTITDLLELRDQSLGLVVLAASLLGACVGFLWYNSFPADVFMGDTGALALGGAIAGFAVFTKTELLLPLVGGVFVAEALSVIIQVVWFKRTGRRVFLMAPIHHHFEMRAWSETKIMIRFWIIAAICAGSAFVLYYLRFDQYNK
jgi:phospho-N-acetylmuramoyl-pentapeptide-transferase